MRCLKKSRVVLASLMLALALCTAGCGRQEGRKQGTEMTVEMTDGRAETETAELPPEETEQEETFDTEAGTDRESGEEKDTAVSAETEMETDEEQALYGAVEDGLMNTLLVAGQDGHIYEFSREDVPVTTGETGILIGNPVTVYYRGMLDDSRLAQDVEVTRIVVEDQEQAASALPLQEDESQTAAGQTEGTGQPEQTEQRARELMEQMSLEEKVGQMFIARCPEGDGAGKASQYHLGGYILFGRDFEGKTKEQVIADIQSYQDAADIPLLIGVDEEGGTVNRVSRYPAFRSQPFASPQELYQEGGFDAIQADTAEKCRLLKELGINLNFAPVCDVSTDPADFIYSRSFGQDAGQTGVYVGTVVSAMKEEGMGSVLKHFPGYGNNADTHTGIAYDNRDYETFAESDFIPFQEGISAGADVVLVSHNIVNCMDSQRPASLSPEVHQILRRDLGFEGVIVTDDLSMDGIRDFVDDGQAAVMAVQAGNDLLCCTDFETQIPAVLEAVEAGEIGEERLNESVMRILCMKLELGIIG